MESKEQVIRRRIAAAQNMAVRQRNYRRARDRALVRLAQAYKEEYLDYLAEEKAKDEQEGKRWHNIAGTDVFTDLDIATSKSSTHRGDTSTDTQDKGDNV